MLDLRHTLSELGLSELTPTDEERDQEGCRGSLDTQGFECELVSEGGEGRKAELAGFCPVALVTGWGFVLPGNSLIGLLKYGSSYYSCSTLARAEQFGKTPLLFLNTINRIVFENSVLKRILQIQDKSQELRGEF